jgi:PGF-pre-PGF domain-containing protein
MKNSKENGVLNYIRVLLSISIVLSIFNPVLVASAESAVNISISSDKVIKDDVANVVISLENCENITGMNMTLVYYQSIASLESTDNITVNNSVTNNHSVTTIVLSSGEVAINVTGLDTITTDSTPIIDVAMLGVASGTTDMQLKNVEYFTTDSSTPTGTISNGQITVNSAPELAEIGDRVINETETLNFSLSAADADNDPLTYSKNVSFGNITGNEFTWTPDSGDNGTYAVSFTVYDGYEEDTENITITVNEKQIINNPPVFDTIADINTTAGSLVNFTVSATDTDNDNLTYYNNSVLPENAAFYPDNKSFVWTPSSNGTYNVNFGVDDGNGGTDSTDVNITVGDVVETNNPPVLTSIGDRVINESELLEIKLNATDEDGDFLTYYKNVSFGNITGDVFSWTPNSSYIGTNYVNFSVNDGELWDHYIANITVNEVVSPVYTPAVPINFTNTTGNFWVLHDWEAGNDNVTDGFNVSYNGTWYNTTVSEFNDSVRLNAHDWSNITVYAYNATSEVLSSGIESKVQIPNNPIKITDVDYSIDVNVSETFYVDVNFTDADSTDVATFGCNRSDLFIDFNMTDGTGSWTPTTAGTYYVDFNVTDGYGSPNSTTMEVIVNDVTYTPSTPVNFVNTTGNFWVFHDWETDNSGNITDGYYIYNDTWTYVSEPTTSFNDTELGPHAWSNITVRAYNATSSTNSSGVESNVQIPNNPIKITDVDFFYEVNEKDTLYIDANYTDPDGDSAVFSSNDTDILDIDESSGVASWETKHNDIGTHYVNLTVADGYGSEDYQVVEITVSKVNSAPELAAIEPQSVSEGQKLTFKLNGTDDDGDTLIYNVSGLPSGATLDNNTGDFSWTPDYDMAGNYTANFSVTDGKETVYQEVPITVENINRDPEFPAFDVVNVAENSTMKLNVTGNDPDSDNLTYSHNASFGTLYDNHTFIWTPGFDDAGLHYIRFTVFDGSENDTAVVTVNVSNTNRAPEFPAFGTVSAAENITLDLNVSATDLDGDLLHYTHNATFGIMDNDTFIWRPDYNASGEYDVMFTVSDGDMDDDTVVTINVSNTNRAPVFTPASDDVTDEGDFFTLELIASDPDDDNLTFTKNVSYGNISGNVFSWTPDYDDKGFHYIQFGVTDGNDWDYDTVMIAVGETNLKPELVFIENQEVNESETLSLTLNSTSPDGDPVEYFIHEGQPSGSEINATTGVFTWTPAYDKSGEYTVTFGVTDGVYDDLQAITIEVNNVNRAPYFGTMPDYNINENVELSITLNATDLDSEDVDSLMFQSNVSFGSINDNVFTWTPSYTANQTSNGTYAINFTVSDGDLIDNSVVIVKVMDANAPPELDTIGSQSVDEEEELIINLTATDLDNDTLTFTIDNKPANATFDTSSGNFSWTPINGEKGTYYVLFGVDDGEDNVTENVSITVTETSSSSSSTTSSSGGGGGGGALTSGEKFDNIDFKDYTLKSVVRDVETTFSFYEENNSIVSLSFTSELNAGQVKAVIEVLKDTSSQVKSPAPGDVYKNMNIYIDSNLGDDVMGDRIINFKVSKSWVEENNIDVSFITLCRYNSDEWDTLSTEATGEDEEYYYFTSTTPGFSPFAISSVDPSAITEEASAEKIEESSVDIEQLQSTEDDEGVPLETGAELPLKKSSSFPYLIVIGLIGVIAIGVVGYRNRDYYDKLRTQLGNPDGKRYRRIKK